jgi:hypothetical protein
MSTGDCGEDDTGLRGHQACDERLASDPRPFQ